MSLLTFYYGLLILLITQLKFRAVTYLFLNNEMITLISTGYFLITLLITIEKPITGSTAFGESLDCYLFIFD